MITSSIARRIANGSTLPAATVGRAFIKTGADEGLHVCSSVGVWSGPFSTGGAEAPLTLTGSADVTQLHVKAHTTQTNPLVTLETSAGSVLSSWHTDHSNNLFLGFEAGKNNTITGSGEEGLGNVYIGYQSGKSTATHHTIRNTAVGYGTLSVIETGNGQNSAFGFQALNLVTTGTKNTAVGVVALSKVTSGASNVGIGVSAGREITTGTGNVAIGLDTMRGVTTQGANTAVGGSALTANAGADNTAIGSNSLFTSTAGDENTALGSLSLFSATTGAKNIAVGYRSGFALTTGSNNILIGHNIDPPSNTANGQLSIGNLIFGTGVDGTTTTVSSGSVGIGVATPVTGSRLDVRGHLALTNAADAAELRFYEPSAGGAHYTAFKAQAQAGSLTYTLPADDGDADDVLTTDGSGGLSWEPVAGGASFPLLAPDGAFGAPSYSFADQATLGFYRIGSGSVALTNNNATYIQFDVTGGAGVAGIDLNGGLGNRIRMVSDAATIMFGGSLDLSISRDSAGVLAIGTGAQGSVAGHLKYTSGLLQPLTVATLPTSVAGRYAYVTDGDASLAWGATVVNTGGGATKYLVWYNGSNWTVAGK